MKKELGHIPMPEQYAEAGSDVMISSSLEALSFFEEYYPKGGTVLLGSLSFVDNEISQMLVWMYIETQTGKPYSLIPVFKEDLQDANDALIENLEPCLKEIFSVYHGQVYASVFTSTGEIVIKKVHRLLHQEQAEQIIELFSGGAITDVLPVELYSHSKHRFVCACWAILTENDASCWQWHPVCLADEEKLQEYDDDDLQDFPIEPNETVVIDGKTFTLIQEPKTGNYHFKLTTNRSKPKILNFSPKTFKISPEQQKKIREIREQKKS